MAKRRTKTVKVTDQIRKLIEGSGISRYQIWQEAGIEQATLSRFMAGKCGLSAKALDKLGEVLDLEVVMHRPKSSKGD